jgi:DNA-binding NarL/FixJ family response regulator
MTVADESRPTLEVGGRSSSEGKRTIGQDVISVAVGEDDFLVREGIGQVLAETDDQFRVTGLYGDFDTLLEAVTRDQPDVVLTDIRMPPTRTDEGIMLAAHLREHLPQVAVVVLSKYVGPAYALRLLEGGSERRGYLLKERVADRTQLVRAIREVASGGSVIDPKVVEALVEARSRSANSSMALLTPREREVLAQIAQGKSNGAIAGELFLTKGGVEKHVNSIFSKLDLPSDAIVSKRVFAALLYLAEGQSPPPGEGEPEGVHA